jgi:hypothetical protein
VGYIAINSVEVVVTGIENLPNVGRIIDSIVHAGVNQVDGITFTFGGLNYNSLRSEAFHKAVQDANSQASAIVQGVGGVIIGIASITTNYGYPLMPEPVTYDGTAIGKGTPITPGPQQVTATVSITYLYL